MILSVLNELKEGEIVGSRDTRCQFGKLLAQSQGIPRDPDNVLPLDILLVFCIRGECRNAGKELLTVFQSPGDHTSVLHGRFIVGMIKFLVFVIDEKISSFGFGGGDGVEILKAVLHDVCTGCDDE